VGGDKKEGKISVYCELAMASGLIASKKWLAWSEHPGWHLAGLFI